MKWELNQLDSSEVLYGCATEAELLIHALNRQPDAVAIRDASGDMTYRELEHEISRVCQALASLGGSSG